MFASEPTRKYFNLLKKFREDFDRLYPSKASEPFSEEKLLEIYAGWTDEQKKAMMDIGTITDMGFEVPERHFHPEKKDRLRTH